MLLFMVGYVCLHLGLGLLTTLFYAVASKIMLLAFALLLLLGGMTLLGAISRELGAYFCREAAALRRILALRTQREHVALRTKAEWCQLQYLNRLKRQRLLASNNRKHLRELFDSIQQELLMAKSELPVDNYKSLCKELRNHHKRANVEAMLALRQRIPCR